MDKITIDPITRLEGHGKIEIFLDEEKNVKNAYLQVPEFKGFEKFCTGRRAEDMPSITSRICGVCPVAHHLASTKALDDAYSVEPPETAVKLRELIYNGYIYADHLLHFYFLASPDFLLDTDTPPASRNILGVIDKVGVEMGKKVIRQRSNGQNIIATLGGKAVHPCFGIPGGVTSPIKREDRERIHEMSKGMVEFSKFTLDLFKEEILEVYSETIQEDRLELYSMGLVEDGKLSHTGGDVNVVDQNGKQFSSFKGSEYLDEISEHVEPWSYMKFPYLKKIGWKGFVDGPDSGIYRVGPLGRLNASDGMKTKQAQEEYRELFEMLGRPVHSTLAYHWARLIEILQAAEMVERLTEDDDIEGDDIKNVPGEPGRGVGIVEAARGVLIHDYSLNERGLLDDVNLIVATTHNAAPMSMSITDAARKYIDGGNIQPDMLNSVERAFRAYDPCLACATHSAMGETPLKIRLLDADKREYAVLTQGMGGQI